jgi:uncharacterized protein (DUF433 family)
MKTLRYNPSEVPTYGLVEAAEYLRLPHRTVATWTGENGIIRQADHNRLSFVNLVELHVLKGMRKVHGVPMQRIRRALEHVRERYPTPHPLADTEFETDGVDIFIRELDEYINVSRHGQQAFKCIVSTYLKRIGRDPKGLPVLLYPFVLDDSDSEPKLISINPRVSFGKPVIAGTGISTAVIAGRFNARESISQLAEEYDRTEAEIEEAVRWESRQQSAA